MASEEKKKPLAVSHMLMFFVIPCVAFIAWASWSLVGSLLEPKPQDIPSRLEAVETARSSGDRWQAVYALSQELQKMKSSGEWEAALTQAERDALFESLVELQREHASDLRFKKYVLLTLGQFASPALLDHVSEELKSENEEIRFFASWSFLELLGRASEEVKGKYLPAVVSWLDDSDPAFRKISVTFLVQHEGAVSREKVRELLEDEDQEVRWNTAVALASVGDETAVPVLKEMFDLRKIRDLDLRSLEDLKQLLASAHEAASKLRSDEVFAAEEELIKKVSPETPEGKAIYEAMGR